MFCMSSLMNNWRRPRQDATLFVSDRLLMANRARGRGQGGFGPTSNHSFAKLQCYVATRAHA